MGHHHHHGHHHGHGHSHHHHHHGDAPTRAIALATVLNIVFVVVEVTAGLISGSLALLADAAHNLGDVLGLFLAWGAMHLAQRQPSQRRTFGFRKSTILAALANAMLILITVGGIAWEAVQRISQPAPVEGSIVIWVAAIGVLINTGSAMLLIRGHRHDANVRGAFLHLLSDAATSFVVVGVGVALTFTNWLWLDPAASLLVAGVIVVGTVSLLRETLDLALDAVPAHIEPAEVEDFLASGEAIGEVHDLHIWALSTTEVALMAHLVIAEGVQPPPDLVCQLAAQLQARFGIAHSTLQLEPLEAAELCPQRPGHAL